MAAFDGMAEAFSRALASRSDSVSPRLFRLGGRLVSVTIAGRQLARRITAAFSHLAVGEAAGEPELTIQLWDGLETGTALPIRYFRDVFARTWPFGRSVLAASGDEAVIGLQSHQAATMYNRRARRIVGWVDSHERLSLFELGKPLQPLLFAWHSDNDTVPVHAGLVARGGYGVLLGGMGGSGKSTTSLLCLKAGFDYLGDDYIGLPAASGETFRGYSFYNSTWLDPEHIGRLAWLEPYSIRGTPEEDKLLVILDGKFDDRLAESAEIRALVLPRVTGLRDTTFRRASSAQAVLRLAPSSILQLPFISSDRALDRMTELATCVPTYWLELGTDLEQIPAGVEGIIEQAGSE